MILGQSIDVISKLQFHEKFLKSSSKIVNTNQWLMFLKHTV